MHVAPSPTGPRFRAVGGGKKSRPVGLRHTARRPGLRRGQLRPGRRERAASRKRARTGAEPGSAYCFSAPNAPLTVVLHEMIVAETQCRERVARLEQAIDDALLDWPLAPVVSRLQALRGVGLIAAVTFMVARLRLAGIVGPEQEGADMERTLSGRADTAVRRKRHAQRREPALAPLQGIEMEAVIGSDQQLPVQVLLYCFGLSVGCYRRRGR